MRTTWFLTTLTLAATALPCRGADAKAVLWQQPGEITLRDWIWGAGGQARAPRAPFEFLEEDSKGTNPKIKVRDAKGDQWIVKFGGENHGDVFGSRLLHVTGYMTEPTYFVAGGTVTGVHDLRRAKRFLGKDGSFTRARFKLRDHKTFTRVEDRDWSWDENPFTGTHELAGLKILMMLTSNWDNKDGRNGRGSNTAVYTKRESTGQLYYAFSDWGATMGKWGGFFARDKWDPAGYRDQTKTFVRSADGRTLEWGYRGKHGEIVSGVTIADVNWLLTYLAPVTDEQLRAGLRASGATAADIDTYARAIRDRITQLERLTAVAQR